MLPQILLSVPLLFLLPLTASATASDHTSLVTRGDGFVRASVQARKGIPKLRRRQEEEIVDNENLGTTYTIEVEIGTPPQNLTLILDTGSPDLWVNPTCTTSGQRRYCQSFPKFDYTKSESINDTGFADILRYGKGNVTIEYVTDVVTIGSGTIEAQIFGIGFESFDIPLGILGLSPPVNPENAYPFVLDNMADQGLIRSRAFSLDLRNVDSPSGAVIFGGVDTSKFVGALAKLPILEPSQTPSGANRYWVSLTGVGLTFPDGSATTSEEIDVPIFLDSGGTLSRLPTPIFLAIGDAFPGAQFDPQSGFYIVDCDIGDQPGSVDFAFGSKIIRVPYADFVWEVQRDLCVVGVLPGDDEPVFGDSFLRAAYVVYDQDNRNLHIAQAADCGDSNIIAIGTGSNAVPSSTGECTASFDTSGPTDSGGLDVTATREPANILTGGIPGVTSVEFGPGPAGTRTSTSGLGLPNPTGTDENAAIRVGAGASQRAFVALVVAYTFACFMF